MDKVIINAGPLTSFNSVVYYLSPKFRKIRELYLKGLTPEIVIDLQNIEYGNVSIAALTSLLCNCKRLRNFLGYPIPAVMHWNPKLQGFLTDIEFFKIADYFNIFRWSPEGIRGDFIIGKTNPNTKIVYYADIKPFKEFGKENIGLAKALLKQKIAPNFLMRCSSLFNLDDESLEDVIVNTTLELIVNSLIHGEDIAFVGMQRTSRRITVSVCDSGIGFAKSLLRSYPNIDYFKKLTNIEGILIGSLIQKNVHGLRLAINEVLNYRNGQTDFNINDGWVTISSYDTEIRWQKYNWDRALTNFDNINIEIDKPDVFQALGEPIKDYIDREKVDLGFWKNYKEPLVGTRITFEINL